LKAFDACRLIVVAIITGFQITSSFILKHDWYKMKIPQPLSEDFQTKLPKQILY